MPNCSSVRNSGRTSMPQTLKQPSASFVPASAVMAAFPQLRWCLRTSCRQYPALRQPSKSAGPLFELVRGIIAEGCYEERMVQRMGLGLPAHFLARVVLFLTDSCLLRAGVHCH